MMVSDSIAYLFNSHVKAVFMFNDSRSRRYTIFVILSTLLAHSFVAVCKICYLRGREVNIIERATF